MITTQYFYSNYLYNSLSNCQYAELEILAVYLHLGQFWSSIIPIVFMTSNIFRTFFEGTIEFAKKVRPKAVWGYYEYPNCYNPRSIRKCANTVVNWNNE